MSDSGGGRSKRAYRPGLEPLEALRPLSMAPSLVAGLPVDVGSSAGFVDDSVSPDRDSIAWDVALSRSMVSDLISTGSGDSFRLRTVDPADVASGLSQLDRYLGRAWYRAGISPQAHDDCTQAVYAGLLESFGSDRFERLVADIGQNGIKDVLSRETPEGPDFFRTIDTVKKRAQREKVYLSLDSIEPANNSPDSVATDRRAGELRETIEHALTPREAALVRATLDGATPAEIAQDWGVASKTISNEKSRVFQKLREVLGPVERN